MTIRDWISLIALTMIGLSVLTSILIAVRYRREYLSVTARVTSVYKTKDSDHVAHFQAYYTFRDGTGREFEGRSVERAHFSPYHEGQEVKVLYYPDNPEKSTIDSFRDKYAWPLFLFALGFVLFLFPRIFGR